MLPTTRSADYNARILQPLVGYLRDHHGADVVDRVAAAAHLESATLQGQNEWISQEEFESFLARARDEFPNDEAFKVAAVHRMAEGYGLMRYLLWASSPAAVYAHAESTYGLMSTIGTPKVLSVSRTALHVRIASDRPISRLNCIVRQAQTADLPTLWGLPPAVLRETSCVALGDAACEYHLRWFDVRRVFPPVAGFVRVTAAAPHGVVPHSEPVTIELECAERATTAPWLLRTSILDELGHELFCAWNIDRGEPCAPRPGRRLRARCMFPGGLLRPGRYGVTVSASEVAGDRPVALYEELVGVVRFEVSPQGYQRHAPGGMVAPRAEWSFGPE